MPTESVSPKKAGERKAIFTSATIPSVVERARADDLAEVVDLRVLEVVQVDGVVHVPEPVEVAELDLLRAHQPVAVHPPDATEAAAGNDYAAAVESATAEARTETLVETGGEYGPGRPD